MPWPPSSSWPIAELLEVLLATRMSATRWIPLLPSDAVVFVSSACNLILNQSCMILHIIIRISLRDLNENIIFQIYCGDLHGTVSIELPSNNFELNTRRLLPSHIPCVGRPHNITTPNGSGGSRTVVVRANALSRHPTRNYGRDSDQLPNACR